MSSSGTEVADGFTLLPFLPILSYVGNMSSGQATARARSCDAKPVRYVARRPIFDREEKVFGYELLFRDSLENCFAGDEDEASRATLDRSLVIGLDVLCDGRRAFVNCTRDTLLKGLVALLPSTSTVVEILESVASDPDVIAACRSLKERGYTIALDDYVAHDRRERLAEMADIIKVDFQLTTETQRGQLIQQFVPCRCRMLAEKVETQNQFMHARDQGFVYFQGFFFRRPEMMGTHDMPANRLNYIRMLQEVGCAELDVPALEKLIKEEASICYRLLRYLNSAVFSFKKEIHSVRHALSLLGESDVRRGTAHCGGWRRTRQDQRSGALGTVWGRFCELLAPKVPHGESDLFLVGPLSLIDAMLETPMQTVLEKIPLDSATKSVLLGQPSVLRPVFSSCWPTKTGIGRQRLG